MKRAILISGTGGQGILAAGEFLSEALFRAGYDVIYSRSYGSEARGGSCRSEVIVSDLEIYDLSLGEADVLIVLSIPAYSRYLGQVKKGGLILIDSSVLKKAEAEGQRDDTEWVSVDATSIAIGLGNIIVANMVLLGALAKHTNLISLEELKGAIREKMRPSMQEINLQALEAGYGA